VRMSSRPSGYHVYRVTPIGTGFQFYLDGTLRTTINQTMPAGTNLKMAISHFSGAASTAMLADYAQFVAYTTTGTLTSTVLDAGRTATWGNVNWNVALPAGTSAIVEVRSGNSATPDATWSAWSATTNAGPIGLPPSRYLQYRVTLLTTDPTQTPTVFDLLFTWT
jgi:hypothetical protein